MKRALTLIGTLAMAIALPSCWEDTTVPPQQLVSAPPMIESTGATPLENVYGLFVGIDKYRFSRAQVSWSEFDDLQGAAGDAKRFKEALRELYSLDFDETSSTGCQTKNALSTTLLDACATREAILSALDARIRELKAGDTLVFYFAGHGSQYVDDEVFDQDSGYNGTILPHDARNPDGSAGEIFDTELKLRKDKATAKGIYFVSVFDSCNSGTATRDGAMGQSRSAPVSTAPPPQLAGPEPDEEDTGEPEPNEATGEGYWVHLAAAQDGQEAQESVSGAVEERAGFFTNALIAAMRMPSLRQASFGDLIREVQLRVASDGRTSQVPSAEGELTAALGSRSRRVIVFDARVEGDGVTLAAGTLSGMTKGSRFALYATQTDAINRQNVLAHAAIESLTPTSSQLTFEPGQTKLLPKVLFAEEVAHFLEPDVLKVSNGFAGSATNGEVARVLAQIEFAREDAGGAVQIAPEPGRPAYARLLAGDGTVLSELGPVGASSFATRLEGELVKIARVNQLLALRTSSRSARSQGGAESGDGGIAFCIATEGYPVDDCPGIEGGGIRRFERGEMATATVINRSDEPLYIYILAVDPRNAVIQVLPRPGENDDKIPPDKPHTRGPISFEESGVYRFVTIASAEQLRVDALQQKGNGTRNFGACKSPLERLLCSASRGTRDPSVNAVGNWQATVSSALVE